MTAVTRARSMMAFNPSCEATYDECTPNSIQSSASEVGAKDTVCTHGGVCAVGCVLLEGAACESYRGFR